MANRRRAQALPRVTPRAGIPAFLLACALVATACSGGDGGGSEPSPSPSPTAIEVKIDGQVYDVASGASVGEALQQAQIKVRNGHLLDVSGEVLEANVNPAKIKVNDRNADRIQVLAAGDAISVIPGRDVTEDVISERERVDGSRPTNPQTLLGGAPGFLITTTGAESGKVASVVFNPRRKPNPPKAVALTFDDGPGRYTRPILDILRKENVPATFYVVGYLVERDPGIIRDIVHDGHSIGNHSWSHPLTPAFAHFESKQLWNQMARTNDALADLDIDPPTFRPPGGSYDAGVVEAARRNGMRTVNWTVSAEDWRSGATPRSIVSTVLRGLRPGAIILLHDGGGDQSATVRALPTLIKEIRSRGYGFQRVV